MPRERSTLDLSINSSMPGFCLRSVADRLQACALILALATTGISCGDDDPHPNGADSTRSGTGPPAVRVPVYGFRVVNSWPHDTGAFTQGLLFHNGSLYESTGLTGRSTLRRVNLETGDLVQRLDLAPDVFAEGLALYDGKLYQLTWRAHKGFVYDLATFRLEKEFAYYNEGWGLTSDSASLYMSDGTNVLRVLDPGNFTVRRTIPVFDGETTVPELNELEWIKGEIWANIWRTDRIVRIDPLTGTVLGYVDLAGLLEPGDTRPGIDVLNGIAWDPKTDRIWVTGKLWPRLFEIRLTAPSTASSRSALH